MKLNIIEKIVGSGFYTGYSPYASGTVASIVAIVIYIIPGFENPTLLMFLVSLFILIGFRLAEKFEKIYGKDPKQFTLDEIIGTWISILFLPKKIWYLLPAFLLWRILDIYKPFPIKKIENLQGGFGVVLDDVAAGLYAFIIIQTSIHFINRLT